MCTTWDEFFLSSAFKRLGHSENKPLTASQMAKLRNLHREAFIEWETTEVNKQLATEGYYLVMRNRFLDKAPLEWWSELVKAFEDTGDWTYKFYVSTPQLKEECDRLGLNVVTIDRTDRLKIMSKERMALEEQEAPEFALEEWEIAEIAKKKQRKAEIAEPEEKRSWKFWKGRE